MDIDVYEQWLGIKDPERPPNYYTLLRLPKFEDDTDKIRNFYRKLNAAVRKYATGQYSVRSQELLNELAQAMLCLTDPTRKEEYDESLGRVIERTGPVPMEKILVKQGDITRDQADEIANHAELTGIPRVDAAVQLKFVERDVATKAYAEEQKIGFLEAKDFQILLTLLQKIPKQTCKRNTILPVQEDDEFITIACVEPFSERLEEELRLRFAGKPVRPRLATLSAINEWTDSSYDELEQLEADAEAAAGGASGSGGKSSKKAADGARPKKQGPRKVFTQLSEGEQRHRKSVGLIAIMWSLIGSAVIDHFLVKPNVEFLNFSDMLPSITTLIVVPCVVLFVLKVYWK